MLPERLNFLKRFDNFYQVIVNAVKEEKIDERDFYIIIGAKTKSMNQDRRDSLNSNKTKS
ncbi:hypothetical protein ES695_01935 [Candidatus Atribacteria bacterium 1244-E10-H5-B2]|nr:MAG: hypothetical protein ES695_01935 [Candidatus Atribacteria bacterium 1244-E10-H5-B2]